MEGVYLLELSNGLLKVGRSDRLGERLRVHDRNLAIGGASVFQSWTCSVGDSVEAERRILRFVQSLPGVERQNGGRETFRGASFFEVMVVARDICHGCLPAQEAARVLLPAPPVPQALLALVEIMDNLDVDRLATRDMEQRLLEHDRALFPSPNREEITAELVKYGVRTRRGRVAKNLGPVQTYMRADLVSAVEARTK